jgi:hypothetical protein
MDYSTRQDSIEQIFLGGAYLLVFIAVSLASDAPERGAESSGRKLWVRYRAKFMAMGRKSLDAATPSPFPSEVPLEVRAQTASRNRYE